jgi:hypothetical protein
MPHVAVRVSEAKGCWVLDHVRIATADSLGRSAVAVEGLWVWVWRRHGLSSFVCNSGAF